MGPFSDRQPGAGVVLCVVDVCLVARFRLRLVEGYFECSGLINYGQVAGYEGLPLGRVAAGGEDVGFESRSFRGRSLGDVVHLCRSQLYEMALRVLRVQVDEGHDRRAVARRGEVYFGKASDVGVAGLGVQSRADSLVAGLSLGAGSRYRHGSRRHRAGDGPRRDSRGDQA